MMLIVLNIPILFLSLFFGDVLSKWEKYISFSHKRSTVLVARHLGASPYKLILGCSGKGFRCNFFFFQDYGVASLMVQNVICFSIDLCSSS